LRDGVQGGQRRPALVPHRAKTASSRAADDEGTERVRIVITPPEVATPEPPPEDEDNDDEAPGPGLVRTLRAEGIAKSLSVTPGGKRSLSLSISSGEVVGLLGPNGAGKTTAFYMIVGLVPCDSGRILLDDART
jgi:ABC-type multidrug transport system fused ATPase/permease subunit